MKLASYWTCFFSRHGHGERMERVDGDGGQLLAPPLHRQLLHQLRHLLLQGCRFHQQRFNMIVLKSQTVSN